MTVAIGLAPNLSLLLRPWAFYALLALILVAVYGAVSLVRSRRRHTGVAALALCLGSMLVVAASILVPPSVYAHVLGAYQAAPSEERKQELAASWDRMHEEITVVDWLLLSKRWDVCHGLWAQSACVSTTSAEAQGIARELITLAAHGG